MEITKTAENYILLGKFLKSHGVANEKLGEIFSDLLNSISYDDLNAFKIIKPFEFCGLINHNTRFKQNINNIEIKVCDANGFSEEDRLKALTKLFIESLENRKPVEIV